MRKELVAFSVRLPVELIEQIDIRAALNHRSRNGEICAMLAALIDEHVERDKKLLETDWGQ